MANQEHLNVLKQGVKTWNRWRKDYPNEAPNLYNAYLRNTNLRGANLSNTELSEASLLGSDLVSANLSNAKLLGTILGAVDFRNANLKNANLSGAHLRGANLTKANLRNADLGGADLHQALLNGADLREAQVGWTLFGDVDLSMIRGLDTVIHEGPSTIGIDTIISSGGNIPEIFLRNAGVPDDWITYMGSLSNNALDFYSCFISYSNNDQTFAERLYTDLRSKGVRCWFAPEDLKIGDHYHQRIDESIRLYDKLILILSEQAIQSSWVEREVVAAREKEDRQQRKVLFPLRLDDAVMDTTKAWAADVRRRWHIGDFIQWKHHDAYQQAFERLLRDLKAEQKTGI